MISPLQVDKSIVIFTHAPRTGGTTLIEHLQQHFGAERSLIDGTDAFIDFNELRLRGDALRRYRFIAGHIVYGVHEKFELPPLYLGLVRNPVDRFNSVVRFIRSDPLHYLHPEIVHLTTDQVLDRLIELNEWRIIGRQCEFLCQLDDSTLAQRNIESKYLLVGPTDRLRDFARILAGFGIGKPALGPPLNKTHAHADCLSTKGEEKLHLIAAEDFRLYEYVTGSFDRIAARIFTREPL
jgi:hypothetical protein